MESETYIPTCVGFILDGNRRWAKERNLPTLEGHKQGYEKLKETLQWSHEAGIQHVVAYVFSTENWNRSPKEIEYLLELTRILFKQEIEKIRRRNWSVRAIGDLSLYPRDIQDFIQKVHDTNPSDPEFTLWLAASYGGRSEILAGVNKLLAQRAQEPCTSAGTQRAQEPCTSAGTERKEQVTEDEFTQVLWTSGMPDPDIIVRTGGQKRLSNFLAWSSGYAELFFLDTYWPAFSKEDFLLILKEFASRKRNFGK